MNSYSSLSSSKFHRNLSELDFWRIVPMLFSMCLCCLLSFEFRFLSSWVHSRWFTAITLTLCLTVFLNHLETEPLFAPVFYGKDASEMKWQSFTLNSSNISTPSINLNQYIFFLISLPSFFPVHALITEHDHTKASVPRNIKKI